VDEKTLRLDRTRYEDGARRAVKVGLIVSEILRRNQIRIKPEDLRAKVDELASTYEDPQAVINWYYADRNRLSDIEAVLLEDSAIDWVLRQAKLEDKVVSVMELLDRPSGATA
jgi:trigger factor